MGWIGDAPDLAPRPDDGSGDIRVADMTPAEIAEAIAAAEATIAEESAAEAAADYPIGTLAWSGIATPGRWAMLIPHPSRGEWEIRWNSGTGRPSQFLGGAWEA